MFNGKLEVGQLVMIIGTRLPVNSHLIGTIATLEALWEVGEDVTSFYNGAKEAGVLVVCGGTGTAVVSGTGHTGSTQSKAFYMNTGWGNLDPKYLMPLPPLEEKQLTKEQELELS